MGHIQYILDCDSNNGNPTCTMQPYSTPPATVDHYTLGPWWSIIVGAVVIIAFLIATAIVRYKAHEERNETERARINKPPATKCPTCGWTESLENV